MAFLYELGIRLYVISIRLAAFFNPKARLWINGRRNWRERYHAPFAPRTKNQEPTTSNQQPTTNNQQPATSNQQPTTNNQQPTTNNQQPTTNNQQPATNNQQPATNNQQPATKILWLHAASLGEFEQGRPIMEAFREQFPGCRIVLTFFSPSGYEIRKNYPHADFVCYLPADTRRNARDFLELIKPDAAIFVKYEFWANYLFELKRRGVQTLLVSALFREKQPFFRWYGGFWRKMLVCFTHIFVQNEASAKLLQRIGFQNISIAGDTRVDRVLKIAEGTKENEIVKSFAGENLTTFQKLSNFVFIAGSSWEADEEAFLRVFQLSESSPPRWKLIIAPHEPSEENVRRICGQVENAVRYSEYQIPPPKPRGLNDSRVLVIDNVGILNTLYRYGTVAYIGGGFGKGIHNTLEPAAFGLPIIFGPKYEKFEEARQFVARGGAFPVRSSEELAAILRKLQDADFYEKASQAVRGYLEESKGATGKVVAFLENLTAS